MSLNITNNTNAQRALPALLLAAATLVALTGCQQRQYNDVDAFLVEPHPVVSGSPYIVSPPDVIAVHSDDARELYNQRVIVGPDGTIDLPLVGNIQVAGRTIEQIDKLIEEKAMQYYQQVDVAVSVAHYRSKHIYVFGEVLTPGSYPYTGSDTLLSILAIAQPTRSSDPKSIQLYRPSKDGENVDRMTINLDKWVKLGITERNALLQEGDIVFVPPNALAEVGYAIQNVLRPIQPAAATLRGSADIDQDYNRIQSQ